MGAFAVGDVLLLGFPFSDLRRVKLRPAVVIGRSDFDNVILCQITSKAPDDNTVTKITGADIDETNVLHQTSYIRANKIFTADPGLVVRKLGRLKAPARNQLHAKLIELFDELAK